MEIWFKYVHMLNAEVMLIYLKLYCDGILEKYF